MIDRFDLAPGYTISRLLKGGWHLAGGHGTIDPAQAVADMATFVEAGITTFDCADIYTGVEELIGRFRAARPDLAGRVQVHTKFVPDLADLDRVDRGYVTRVIDRSLQRLGMDRLDIVQFHWWDYAVPGFVEAATVLEDLRRAGKIRLIGATNFDTPRLAEILGAGVPVATHQVQYSVLDRRPTHGMDALAETHGVHFLCYGTVAGGFLSERWVGVPAPEIATITNRSLIKYRLIIDECGGWEWFQSLLAVLGRVASKHGCDIASVATRVVLDWPRVAGAIVGAVNTTHVASHERVSGVHLDDGDRDAISAVMGVTGGPPGDVYTLERDREGTHGRIMKYNLSK
ncbi:MAG: aldo/keto reductase [Chloroflexi bacterium]|nr:aldo/keto reductase [Chloroflexota bacterium]